MDVNVSTASDNRNFLAATDVLISLAKSLHHVGFPSNVIEEKVGQAAAVLKIRLEMLCLPTGMMMTFYRGDEPVTYALRERPGAVNLERMTLLMQTARGLIAEKLSLDQAKSRIVQIMQSADRWGSFFVVCAYVLSAGAFAVFFGGGSKEILVAVFVGLAAGITSVAMRRHGSTRLFELVAATSAAAIAGFGDRIFGEYVEWIPIAAGLIILLPGISLIDAVSELSRGHLVSGMARLAGVGVAFLALTFGCVVGISISDLVPHSQQKIQSHPLGEWWLLPALIVVAVGSTIRFRARPKDVLIILAASALSLFTARFAADTLGSATGPFVAAMVLGLAATLFARLGDKTPELVVIPGIALLVPGSVGVRSLSSLLSQQTDMGIDAAFQMFLIAMALASGLMFSQTLLRDRMPDAYRPT